MTVKLTLRSSIQFAHHTVVATATDRLYEIVQAWKAAVAEIADVEGLYPTFVLNTMPKSAASVAKTNGVGNVWGLEDDESLISRFINKPSGLTMVFYHLTNRRYQFGNSQPDGLTLPMICALPLGRRTSSSTTTPSTKTWALHTSSCTWAMPGNSKTRTSPSPRRMSRSYEPSEPVTTPGMFSPN